MLNNINYIAVNKMHEFFKEVGKLENLKSGDISPSDDVELNLIIDRLEKLGERYVKYNKTNQIQN